MSSPKTSSEILALQPAGPHASASACSRRALLQSLGLLSVGSLVGGVACNPREGIGIGDSSPPPSAQAANCGAALCIDIRSPANTALASVNGALYFETPSGATLLVIRTSVDAVAALSAVCTHQGCYVAFDSGKSLLVCPCHGSEFAESGEVRRGPARRALPSYAATLSGNEITVVL